MKRELFLQGPKKRRFFLRRWKTRAQSIWSLMVYMMAGYVIVKWAAQYLGAWFWGSPGPAGPDGLFKQIVGIILAIFLSYFCVTSACHARDKRPKPSKGNFALSRSFITLYMWLCGISGGITILGIVLHWFG